MKTFRAYRIESDPGDLSGKNAANLKLLMGMLMAKARPVGSRVGVYEVQADGFGPYVSYNAGRGDDRGDPRVGYVRDEDGNVFYSFPPGGRWSARLVTYRPMPFLLARLRVQGEKSVRSYLRGF